MDKRLKVAGLTQPSSPHDLRRSSRTLLAQLGVPQDLAEGMMGHVTTGIVATYNRHTYEGEMEQAWQQLADEIDRIEAEPAPPAERTDTRSLRRLCQQRRSRRRHQQHRRHRRHRRQRVNVEGSDR
jgi:hypothetical protein